MPEWFNFTISLLIPEESLTEANLEPILIQANTDNLVSTAWLNTSTPTTYYNSNSQQNISVKKIRCLHLLAQAYLSGMDKQRYLETLLKL